MVIPQSAAAAESIDAFPGPVEAINFNLGSRFSNDAGIGVRSRITQMMSNGASRSATAS
jgi:hypothetical protein